MKKSAIAALAIAAIFLINGCATQAPQQQEEQSASSTVTISNFAFGPAVTTVKKRTEVSWTNEDAVAHTVVSQGLFESEALRKGNTFSFTFQEPGEYDYYCGLHPSMKGKIKVE